MDRTRVAIGLGVAVATGAAITTIALAPIPPPGFTEDASDIARETVDWGYAPGVGRMPRNCVVILGEGEEGDPHAHAPCPFLEARMEAAAGPHGFLPEAGRLLAGPTLFGPPILAGPSGFINTAILTNNQQPPGGDAATAPWYKEIISSWVVPPLPVTPVTNGWDNALWPGFENGGGNIVLQPVLQVGAGFINLKPGQFGGLWAVANIECCVSGVEFSSIIHYVTPGDTIVGWIALDESRPCDPYGVTGCYWTVGTAVNPAGDVPITAPSSINYTLGGNAIYANGQPLPSSYSEYHLGFANDPVGSFVLLEVQEFDNGNTVNDWPGGTGTAVTFTVQTLYQAGANFHDSIPRRILSPSAQTVGFNPPTPVNCQAMPGATHCLIGSSGNTTTIGW